MHNFKKTKKVSDFVIEIDQESEKFEEFSLKAKNIRNNVHVGTNCLCLTSFFSNIYAISWRSIIFGERKQNTTRKNH